MSISFRAEWTLFEHCSHASISDFMQGNLYHSFKVMAVDHWCWGLSCGGPVRIPVLILTVVMFSVVSVSHVIGWFMFYIRRDWLGSVWARELCRISPPRFLAERLIRRLNQGSFVLLCFALCAFSGLCLVFVLCLLICLLSCIFQREPTSMASV